MRKSGLTTHCSATKAAAESTAVLKSSAACVRLAAFVKSPCLVRRVRPSRTRLRKPDSPVDTAAGFTWLWDFGDGETSPEQDPTHAYALPGTYTVSLTATDKDGGSSTVATTAEITGRPTELTNLGQFAGQYSDAITVEAQLHDIVDGSQVEGAPVGIMVGIQTVAPVPVTDASGTASSTLILDQPAGTKWLTSFYEGNDVHLASMDIDVFVVLKENVESDYSGDQIVPITEDSFTLRAVVTEEQDGSLGELSRATVEFSIYRMQDGSLVATYGPIGVIPVDGMAGVGIAETTAANLPEGEYYVVVRPEADNSYYGGPASLPAALTVYEPTGQFTTGGGRLDLDDGSHSTFSINIRYNKRATNVQGRAHYIFRQDGLDYFVKSNRLDGFVVQDDTAAVQGKANVTATDPITGEVFEIGGNYTFVIRIVDNGEPGRDDVYEITVRDPDGIVFHQVSARTLAGGNILIHR